MENKDLARFLTTREDLIQDLLACVNFYKYHEHKCHDGTFKVDLRVSGIGWAKEALNKIESEAKRSEGTEHG